MHDSIRSPRRRLLAGATAAGASAFIPLRSSAVTPFRARFGTDTAPNQSATRFAGEMIRAIETESGGAIQIDFFPGSTLGGSTSLVDQMRVGALEFVMVSASFVAGVEPTADIQGAGFAFKDPAAGYRALDGALGQFIQKRMLAKGVYRFDKIWASGFAQALCNVRPIRTAPDFNGLKIQTSSSKMGNNFLSTLGAVPVPTNPADRYVALQTHVSDGTLITLNNAEGLRLYEVQKYLSIINGFFSSYYLMANGDVWNRMPADVKAIVTRNADKYALLQRKDSDAADEKLVGLIASQGCAVNRTDPAAFRPKLGPHYAFCRELVGAEAWALLEKSVGPLG